MKGIIFDEEKRTCTTGIEKTMTTLNQLKNANLLFAEKNRSRLLGSLLLFLLQHIRPFRQRVDVGAQAGRL